MNAKFLAELRTYQASDLPECTWIHREEWDSDYWETSCDNAFEFTAGSPYDNGMKFCPYCGCIIFQVEEGRLKNINITGNTMGKTATATSEENFQNG